MEARILIIFVLLAASSIDKSGNSTRTFTPESQIGANTFSFKNNEKKHPVESNSIQHWRS